MHQLLIIWLIISILEYLAPIIIKYVVTWYYAKTDSEIYILEEIKDIKKQMNGLSIVDEFAKFAKLQRKQNKLEGDYQKKADDRLSSKIKVQLVATYGYKLINLLVNCVLLYMYRGVLVFTFSQGTLWPMESILSWPSPEGYGISFLQWILMTSFMKTVIMKKVL